MPSLPKAQRRPWQPPPAKRQYAAHGEERDKRYDSPQWRALRKAQLARKPCCELCEANGKVMGANVADHIKPVRLGGGFYDANNLQSLCYPCHQSKSASERKFHHKNDHSDPERG